MTTRRGNGNHPIPDTMTDEDHPTEFVVEGRDRTTNVWRRMTLHASDKNNAIVAAEREGLSPEIVREARPAERPMTGIDAPQREFGFGGIVSVALGILGVLSVVTAVLMRQSSPGFALVVGILGLLIAIYGIVGAFTFWALSRSNRDSR